MPPRYDALLTQSRMRENRPSTACGRTARAGTVNSSIGPSMVSPESVDGVDMLHGIVDEEHLHTRSQEIGADGAADCTRAPDQNLVAHAQGPSINARVSSTATAQMASISSSLRWQKPP